MELELPFRQPKNWEEVGANYEALQKQLSNHVRKLALKYPKERTQALSELNPIIETLKAVARDLEKFNKKWFLTPDRKITELGVAGRAVYSDLFALPELERVISILGKVANSLTGSVSDEKK